MPFPTRLIAVLTLLLLAPAAAFAQSSWAVAQRAPEQITGLIGKLEPYVEKLPGEKSASGVVLYSQVQFDVRSKDKKTRYCRNYVLEVRDPSLELPHVFNPTFSADLEIAEAFAFVLRGDEVRSLEPAQITITNSDAEHLRASVGFDFGELKKNDIIGWSVVGESQGPILGEHIPLADIFPVVIGNVKVSTDGQTAYRLMGQGHPPKEIDLDEKNLENGKPTLYSMTMRALPAQPQAWAQGPFPESFPHVRFHLAEAFVEESQQIRAGWMPVGDHNTLATIAHGMVDQAAKKTKGLDMVLGAVTSGKTTDISKETAIYKYVRDNLKLVEGEQVERLGARSPEEILRSREATALEKVILMAVMLSQVDTPASVAFLRDGSLGGVDDGVALMIQVSDAVVRAGGEEARYYAPQCGECAPGDLPPAWQGVAVLSAQDGMAELLEEFQNTMIEKFTTAARTPTPDEIAQLQAEQTWFRLEKTPVR